MNGTNYRLHMYNPDNLTGINLPVIVGAEDSESACYLFPFKKVLRDTQINQLTFYIEALIDPPDGTVDCRVCLYRCIDSLVDAAPSGRTVGEKIVGTEVQVTGGASSVISQTQWVFSSTQLLEGGSYWIAVAIQATNPTRDPALASYNFVGITDADSNINYPKYTLTLATPMTLPSTIDISNMAYKTDYWFYASGEYY